MTPDPTLATIWAFLIATAVFLYVVMDGFDLGIGILFPAFRVGELVPPRTLPSTSSGKLSRAKARNLYLNGEIKPYALAA